MKFAQFTAPSLIFDIGFSERSEEDKVEEVLERRQYLYFPLFPAVYAQFYTDVQSELFKLFVVTQFKFPIIPRFATTQKSASPTVYLLTTLAVTTVPTINHLWLVTNEGKTKNFSLILLYLLAFIFDCAFRLRSDSSPAPELPTCAGFCDCSFQQ